MLPKKIYVIALAVSLLNCSVPVKKNIRPEDELSGIIRANIKEEASKKAATCKVASLNILRIDTVTSSTLDSQLLIKTANRYEYCNVLSELYLSMAKTNMRINALTKKVKGGSIRDMPAPDLEDDAQKAQVYKDSATYYSQLLDSLNKIRMNNDRFTDTLYQVKTFLKSTEFKNGDSTNYAGTKYYFIRKDKKVLDVSETELLRLKATAIH